MAAREDGPNSTQSQGISETIKDRRTFLKSTGAAAGAAIAIGGCASSAEAQGLPSDLSALQEKLRNDPNLRSKFATDPVDVLQQNGIKLNDEQLSKLKQELNAAKARTNNNLSSGVSVGITVGN